MDKPVSPPQAPQTSSPTQVPPTVGQDVVSTVESTVHPDLPKLTSTKRIFHIPVKSLMLEEKPYAKGTCGPVMKGLYMGNPIAAKPIINIVKRAKAKGENKVDLNEFDNEVAILMRLSHPSIVSCFGASIDESDGSVYQVREYSTHIASSCCTLGTSLSYFDVC